MKTYEEAGRGREVIVLMEIEIQVGRKELEREKSCARDLACEQNLVKRPFKLDLDLVSETATTLT